MIIADRCDRADFWSLNHISGVKSASHPTLKDCILYFMSFKLQEGNHSHYLKEGYIELL